MRKVLLVDDEKFIRKGIRVILEQTDTDFREIVECINGQEAMKALGEQKFDLVITDIRMPFMDGIALMREAQSLPDKPVFIVLSGYDDFHYAKEAIQFGAKAYILKPVRPEELVDTLRRVGKFLDESEQQSQSTERVKNILSQLAENELALILQDESIAQEKVRNMLDALELNIFDSEFHIALLRKTDFHEDAAMYEDFLATLDPVNSSINTFNGQALSIKIKNNLVLVLNSSLPFDELLHILPDEKKELMSMGVSTAGKSPLDIHRCYREACEAQKHCILTPENPIVRYSDLGKLKSSFKTPVDEVRKLPQMVAGGRMKEAEQLLGSLLQETVIRAYRIQYLHSLTDSIHQNVLVYFDGLVPHKSELLEQCRGQLEDISNFRSVSSYHETLKQYLSEIRRILDSAKDMYRERNEIEMAIAYVLENYHKDINMSVVANHVSVNYYYFSARFKEETGLNFIDYIKKVRIDKSKELLRDTDLKIHEIAVKVGFQSIKHYTRTFRKMTGVSPVEFRHMKIR